MTPQLQHELTVVAAISIPISLILIVGLWWKREGGIFKKLFWSLVICVPFLGWVFYGAFYKPPGETPIKAKGDASGWGYWPRP